MAGSAQPLAVSVGAVNGARAAYELHAPESQENTSVSKPSTTNGTWNSLVSRTPLTSVIPNRKNGNDMLQPGQLTHTRVEELGKHDSSISRSGSEADSLLDLYRRNPSNVDLNSLDHEIPENMYLPENEDPEGWIHRDKLAKIENEELQAAGINLANARRTISKSGRRAPSREGYGEGSVVNESTSRPGREEKRQRISSPVAEEQDTEREDWDLRNPDEIAEESNPITPVYSNPILRKTGSKIPVLTASPLPIPQDRLERDTPLPRQRTMSGSMSPDDNLALSKMRPRRSSAGSQILLDEGSPPSSAPQSESKTASPTKSKSPNAPSAAPYGSRKTQPAARKGSAITKAGVSPRATNSPGQRPGTASLDNMDRPKTAINRPEGDPPWLATMYKPDPRLPPDQQIIPTHARRQQQAQWDAEGAIPNTYDRDFTPLSVYAPPGNSNKPQPSTPPVMKPDDIDHPAYPFDSNAEPNHHYRHDDNAWPLKPMPSVRSNNTSTSGAGIARPGTSGSHTGSYSTMPKVASPPIGMPSSSPRPEHGAPTRLMEQKMPAGSTDLEGQQGQRRGRRENREKAAAEEEGEDKGCGGCCVLM